MLKEFKEFALKGNVMDLAIGVIIGGAFGKIVTSLVQDLIMPIFALLTSGMNFEDMAYVSGNVTIKYGSFIQTVVDFLIISFSIFIAVKLINRARKKEEVEVDAASAAKAASGAVSAPQAGSSAQAPQPQGPSQSGGQSQQAELELLTEIRDLLKKR
ncbi:large conductance mechanosensitive channel protein MscL [Anoxybacterium hadale]|uniref:Large conductance mechanosensitive channel protein MscL n=1 Tax=Anoxybacterium hadale TaxID=3408580 RepID=A0ACD1AF84_9FIRM|nr:large conductance mechanosensitive channel protein MscL [Clostridiales bacterium]